MPHYSQRDVERVGRAVQRSLTPDLLKPRYRRLHQHSVVHPMTGYCAVASEALYHLLGGKAAGLTPVVLRIWDGTHWWLRDRSGNVIDLTAQQFGDPVPYHLGRGCGFPTPGAGPSKGAALVMRRARALLRQEASARSRVA